MKRRDAVLGLIALGATPRAWAQLATKTARIGWLTSSSDSDPMGRSLEDSFRQGLRELGWIEGRNIVTERRFAEGKVERLSELASELVRHKVDIIVAMPFASARAAKDASDTIPIVMIAVGDPVGSGLIASLARPGGNITGRSFDVSPEINAKLLQLLIQVVPKLSRVAVLWNPDSPFHHSYLKDIRGAAQAAGIRLQDFAVQKSNEVEGAFHEMARERAGGLIVLTDAFMTFNRDQIVKLAAQTRLPTIYGNSLFLDAGGLMSYGANFVDIWRGAAAYVDRILKGAKPSELPVEQPTKFDLVINLKTAKALNLSFPQPLLISANRVIE